jgi:hypothetical protein
MSEALVEKAYAFLRSHWRGDLRFDEHERAIEYVIAPEGPLVAPVMVAMLRAGDVVLAVPANTDGAMELSVTVEPFEERGADGALADRWRIHHGEPPDVRWARLRIDAARFGESIIDGVALERENPLASVEARLCREINRDPERIRVLCRLRAGVDVEAPVMVAVDPLGIDVRGRFDVFRVAASRPFESADDVMAQLDAIAAGA